MNIIKSIRPTAYGKGKPRTISEAILQARRLLQAEGRWVRKVWFTEHKTIDPQKPLCSQGWGACAEGALQAVIFGVPMVQKPNGTCTIVDRAAPPTDGNTADLRLYKQAVAFLDEAARQTGTDKYGQPLYNGIINLNDNSTTRTQVIKTFTRAEKAARKVQRHLPKGMTYAGPVVRKAIQVTA